ncbi:MAG: ABC transporter ATP-binding protein [Acholeplasmatales bacterium]|nr:MAG: ABC transporter ATP-binding protein [Acholeplasmatales bacterium]
MCMIRVSGLKKNYGLVQAVKGIDFTVRGNAFFALLGPNGAGKSTTIEIIATLLAPASGSVEVNGHKLGSADDAIRKTLGVVFQYSTLDPVLTVHENLKLRAAFYGLAGEAYATRLAALDERIHFGSYADQPVRTLSGGQRRKADIARALLHSPQILILDEPTTGLDPKSRKEIWSLILSLKEQTDMTIFLTTHYMEEVLDADHVIIMNEGEIVAEDSAENLRLTYANDTLKVIPLDGLEAMLQENSIDYHAVNRTLHIPLDNPFQGLDYLTRFRDNIETFEIIKASMDDVFLNITGRKLEDNHDR